MDFMKTINQNKNSSIDISEVNMLAENPAAFISRCEEEYRSQLEALAERVKESGGLYRVIALAGPSSSGKTTTAHKLSKEFGRCGVEAPVVSLDDFYLGRDLYPKLSNGQPDMEAVEALDLPLINETLKELTQNGVATFPVFDFENSCRSSVNNMISLGENGVLIIEGIHALNPRLVELMDKNRIFKVYVSVRTKYMLGEEEILCPKDARLIRRMVRDHNFRGKAPWETLKSWKEVLDGEEKHIYPFRDEVDYKIDSALDYEGCVFHHYILPMIDAFKDQGVYSDKLGQIVDILECFNDIDKAYIPKDSLLREFIG